MVTRNIQKGSKVQRWIADRGVENASRSFRCLALSNRLKISSRFVLTD